MFFSPQKDKMLEELIKQCKNLKLSTEETQAIGNDKSHKALFGSNEKFLIVASLISPLPYNFKALGRIIEGVWRLVKGLKFRKIRDNIVLFESKSKKDHDRVLEGSPWSFDKNLLITQLYDSK